jgi:hypothetical protein
MGYSFIAADLLTNEILAELPIKRGAQVSRVLSGTGTFQGVVPLGDARYARLDLIRGTDPNRTVLYIDKDDVLIWGGIIWGRQYSSDTKELEITGLEFASFFTKHYLSVDSDAIFPREAVDQFDLFRALINYVQTKPFANLGIDLGSGDSGILRDRFWNGFEFKEIAEACQQLSEVENGFDWLFDVRYDESHIPSRYLTLGYPQLGRAAESTSFLFEKPGNLVKYAYPEDGSGQALETFAVGAGEGDAMLIADTYLPGLHDEGYPLLQQVTQYKDVTIPATLRGHANRDEAKAEFPRTAQVVTVRQDQDPLFGDYVLGDEAVFRITDERFPLVESRGVGVEMTRRIVGWSITTDGVTADLTLEETFA